MLHILSCASFSCISLCSTGPCPSGTFVCDNGVKCLPQRRICDKREDCSDGSDEDPVECGMWHGSQALVKKIVIMDYAQSNDSLEGTAYDSYLDCGGWFTTFFVHAVTSINHLVMALLLDVSWYPESCACGHRDLIICRRNNMKVIPKISSEVCMYTL